METFTLYIVIVITLLAAGYIWLRRKRISHITDGEALFELVYGTNGQNWILLNLQAESQIS